MRDALLRPALRNPGLAMIPRKSRRKNRFLIFPASRPKPQVILALAVAEARKANAVSDGR